jgi:hypothetical protein
MATSVQRAAGSRTARYRKRQAFLGTKRVEVTVPTVDIELIRRLATELRTGGEHAERLRASVRSAFGRQPAQTGDELVDFFRSSPLIGEDLSFERDRSPGREIDL